MPRYRGLVPSLTSGAVVNLKKLVALNHMTRPNNEPLLFTPESASRTLPLVKVIVNDITSLYALLVERRSRLECLLSDLSNSSHQASFEEEKADIDRQLKEDATRLESYLSELDDLGVISRMTIEGEVRFPSIIDGQVVELSWQQGEDSVAHFVELDGTERKPLSPQSVA